MALTIDSRAVFRAIAEHPDAFPAIQPDLDDIARKLLVKQLKAKGTDASTLKAIYDVIGEADMAKMLDGLAANELSALVKKIDPYSPHVGGGMGDTKGARSHIADLAKGRAALSVKPEKIATPKAPKAPKATPPKIGGILESKVHSGVKPKATRAKKTV